MCILKTRTNSSLAVVSLCFVCGYALNSARAAGPVFPGQDVGRADFYSNQGKPADSAEASQRPESKAGDTRKKAPPKASEDPLKKPQKITEVKAEIKRDERGEFDPSDAPKQLQAPPYAIVNGKVKLPSYPTIQTQKMVRHKNFFAGGAYLGGTNFSLTKGWQAAFGYEPGMLGFDARFGVASVAYQAIKANLDPGSAPTDAAFVNLDSEFNRFRAKLDPWTAIHYDIGLTLNAVMMDSILPGFSQKVRFALGSGRFTDQINSLVFRPIYVAFDIGMQYHFWPRSPFALDVSWQWRTGFMSTSDGRTFQMSMLPMNWSAFNLGFLVFL